MARRSNDGNTTGMKIDRFRNSRFEDDVYDQQQSNLGATRSGPNTLGGKWAENRGHRSADDGLYGPRNENPFENGDLGNWNHKRGWDQYFTDKSFRRGRDGGAIIGADETNHRGRGPKGYSRSDERILEDVCETLSLNSDVDATDIDVSVKEGCVYLRGSVESRETKRLAEQILDNVSGVKDVQNLLTVKKAG